MKRISRWFERAGRYVASIIHRDSATRELEEEIRVHIAMRAEWNAANGASPRDAMYAAQRRFGNVPLVVEESRDAWVGRWVDHLSQDLRYAARSLLRTPALATGAVATLAIGMAATITMSTLANELFLRPPTYLRGPADFNRLYQQWQGRPAHSQFAYTRFRDLQRSTIGSLDLIAAARYRPLVGAGNATHEEDVVALSPSAFSLFDMHPTLGRFLEPSDDGLPSGSLVVVISDEYWRAVYDADPAVVGRALQIGSQRYAIVGVAPKGFAAFETSSHPVAFIPITTMGAYLWGDRVDPSYATTYGFEWVDIIVRRRPGTGVHDATAALDAAVARSRRAEQDASPTPSADATPAPRIMLSSINPYLGPIPSSVAQVTRFLAIIAALLLVIGCANAANLLVVRAIGRRKVIELRVALGVSRARLWSQFLSEGIVIAFVATALGLAASRLGVTAVSRLIVRDRASLGMSDGSIMLYSALCVAGIVLVCAVMPAVAFGSGSSGILRGGMRNRGPADALLHRGLLVVQVGLSAALATGAGLFSTSLLKARDVPLGFDAQHVLYAEPEMRSAGLDQQRRTQLDEHLLIDARHIPGVVAAARVGLSAPFVSNVSSRLAVPGVDRRDLATRGKFVLTVVSADYFAVMGTSILRGRPIAEQDRDGSIPVAVVSKSMAHALWPDADAIGQCIRLGADTSPCRTVVGVAEDVRGRSIVGDAGMSYYLPIAQTGGEGHGIVLRVGRDAAVQQVSVQRVLQRALPGMAYMRVRSFAEIVEPQYESWKLGTAVTASFGAIALLLAGIGLYSVLSHRMAERRHEMGIRAALGATPASLVSLVMRLAVASVVTGLVAAGAIVAAARPWIQPLLFGIRAYDAHVLAAVAAVEIVLALVGSSVPAARAARIDPAVTLRES